MVRALSLTLLLLLAACAGDDAADAPGLSATATRSSLFDSQRTFRLELANVGAEDARVTSLQLRSPLFERLPASERDVVLAPGERVLVPLPYGEAVCPAAPGPSVVVVGEGVEVPLAQDPEHVVDDLHALECDQAAVREAAAPAFGDEWTPTGPRSARGEVVIQGGEVEAMAGNIVFGVRLDDGVLPSATSFPVEVVVDRCDTHALIESKRTFQFPLDVSLDGGEPITYVLEAEVDSPAREVMAELIQACIG